MRPLTTDEQLLVDAKSIDPKPTWYSATEKAPVPISDDGQTHLIFLPKAVKRAALQTLQNSKAKGHTKERVDLFAKFTNNRVNTLQKRQQVYDADISSVTSAIDGLSPDSSELGTSMVGIASSEVSMIKNDMGKALPEVTARRENVNFKRRYLDITSRARFDESASSVNEKKRISSWKQLLANY